MEKLQGEVKQTQDEIASFLTQTSQTQEKIDREFAVLRAEQSDLEKARSQILIVSRELSTSSRPSKETIKSAQTALEHRNAEQQEETKALAKRERTSRS